MKHFIVWACLMLGLLCNTAQAEKFERLVLTNSESHWSIGEKWIEENFADTLKKKGQKPPQMIGNSGTIDPAFKGRGVRGKIRKGDKITYSLGKVKFGKSGERYVFKLEKIVRGKKTLLPSKKVARAQARIEGVEFQVVKQDKKGPKDPIVKNDPFLSAPLAFSTPGTPQPLDLFTPEEKERAQQKLLELEAQIAADKAALEQAKVASAQTPPPQDPPKQPGTQAANEKVNATDSQQSSQSNTHAPPNTPPPPPPPAPDSWFKRNLGIIAGGISIISIATVMIMRHRKRNQSAPTTDDPSPADQKPTGPRFQKSTLPGTGDIPPPPPLQTHPKNSLRRGNAGNNVARLQRELPVLEATLERKKVNEKLAEKAFHLAQRELEEAQAEIAKIKQEAMDQQRLDRPQLEQQAQALENTLRKRIEPHWEDKKKAFEEAQAETLEADRALKAHHANIATVSGEIITFAPLQGTSTIASPPDQAAA